MKKNSVMGVSCRSHIICRSCERCLNVCPAGIDIPKALRIYEEFRSGTGRALEKLNSMDSQHQPLDCIECGRCSVHCPQGVDAAGAVRQLAMIQACPPATAGAKAGAEALMGAWMEAWTEDSGPIKQSGNIEK